MMDATVNPMSASDLRAVRQDEDKLRRKPQAGAPVAQEALSLDKSPDNVIPLASVGDVQLANDERDTDEDTSTPLDCEIDLASQESVSKVVTARPKFDALPGAEPELPLSSVKRAMEQTERENAQPIGADATLCLERACQLLVRTIAARSWAICTEDSRDTVQATDVIATFEADDRFDFLAETIQRLKLERETTPAAAA